MAVGLLARCPVGEPIDEFLGRQRSRENVALDLIAAEVGQHCVNREQGPDRARTFESEATWVSNDQRSPPTRVCTESTKTRIVPRYAGVNDARPSRRASLVFGALGGQYFCR